MTGQDLIASSLRLIGALASGETPPAAEAADALVILNQMLDGWSASELTVFTTARQVFTLQAGKQTYTMGAGGDFNVPRPARIQYWSIISNQNPGQPLELAANSDFLTDSEWQAVRVKNITSSLPRKLYDDGGFPLRSLSFWPVPDNSTVQAALYTWNALQQFADLTTDYSFPPGYMEAIKYNFAIRLAAEWPGNLSPATPVLAQQALANIKSMNAPIVKLGCDEALTGGGGVYNWRTDGFSS
jgi:hypothetical protein